MNRVKKIAVWRLPLLLVLLLAAAVQGQGVELRLNGLAARPVGDYARLIDRFAYGIEGAFLLPIGDGPLAAGLNLAILSYQQPAYRLQTDIDRTFYEPIDGAILSHLIVRLQMSDQRWRPYAEALFGLQHFFLETDSQSGPIAGEIADGSAYATDEVERVWSGGLGAGVLWRIRQIPEEEPEKTFRALYIDLKLRYLLSGRVDFARRTATADAAPQIVRSRTDLLSLHLGVGVEF